MRSPRQTRSTQKQQEASGEMCTHWHPTNHGTHTLHTGPGTPVRIHHTHPAARDCPAPNSSAISVHTLVEPWQQTHTAPTWPYTMEPWQCSHTCCTQEAYMHRSAQRSGSGNCLNSSAPSPCLGTLPGSREAALGGSRLRSIWPR